MTDAFLETVRPTENGSSEHFLKSRRQILSFLTISKIFGTYNFSIGNIIALDLKLYSTKELIEVWELISSSDTIQRIGKKVKHSSLIGLLHKATEEWKIKGIERFLRGNNLDLNNYEKEAKVKQKSKITMEFAEKVNMLLPQQPWKPGVDKEVIAKLDCTRSEYFDAVSLLIEEGIRNRQKDGVVYDEEGNVIAFDNERVDADTLELKRIE